MVITILHLIQFMPNVSADYHLRYLILSISSRHDFQLSHFTSLRKRQTRGFRNNSSSNMLWRSIQRVETRSHIAPPKLAWPGEPLSREVQQFHIRTTRDLLLQFRRHNPPRLTFNSSFRRFQHSKLSRTRARRGRGKIAWMLDDFRRFSCSFPKAGLRRRARILSRSELLHRRE